MLLFLLKALPDSFKINIGRDYANNPEFYNGLADDLRIYDRALSKEEIEELYNLEKPETALEKGLVAYYRSMALPPMKAATAITAGLKGQLEWPIATVKAAPISLMAKMILLKFRGRGLKLICILSFWFIIGTSGPGNNR